MMRELGAIAGILVLNLLPSAYAAETPPRSVCLPLVDLTKGVRDCSQNHIYAQAAERCLNKMEAEIETKKATLSLLMAASSAAAASAQAARFENNNQNISNLVRTIDDLTSEADRARREIVQYSENFVFAGPISKHMAVKLKMVKYLSLFDCFSVPKALVTRTVKKLDQHIAEFQKVTSNARALEAKTSVALKKVDSTSLTGKVSNRAPASAGVPAYAAPAPKKGTGPSSITGTEKAGQNERALQRLTK